MLFQQHKRALNCIVHVWQTLPLCIPLHFMYSVHILCSVNIFYLLSFHLKKNPHAKRALERSIIKWMQTIFFWNLLTRHVAEAFHVNPSLRPSPAARPPASLPSSGQLASPVAQAVLDTVLPSIHLSPTDDAQVRLLSLWLPFCGPAQLSYCFATNSSIIVPRALTLRV